MLTAAWPRRVLGSGRGGHGGLNVQAMWSSRHGCSVDSGWSRCLVAWWLGCIFFQSKPVLGLDRRKITHSLWKKMWKTTEHPDTVAVKVFPHGETKDCAPKGTGSTSNESQSRTDQCSFGQHGSQ